MVIPVHDQNPVRRTPIVTYALIATNVVVFLLGPVAGLNGHYGTGTQRACAENAYFREYGAIPKELVNDEPLPAQPTIVETDKGRVVCTAKPVHKVPFLSVLYAMFLHGGWLHLIGNMLFLFVFGNNVEDRMGRLRYLLFYLGVGYLATYAFALVYADSSQALVGASGAIAGVLGAYLYLYPRAKVTSLVPFLFFIPLRFPAWLVLGFWFVLQWLYLQGAGLAGDAGVAYFAHVAGFVLGFAYAAVTLSRREPPWAPDRNTSPSTWPYGS
jgi:membrane associated rhomboid family serine protease